MNVILIGSNGTLATAVGQYCNHCNYHLQVYGRSNPERYTCDDFVRVDLLKSKVGSWNFQGADLVIYAAGGGIQSNKKESFEDIFRLNVEVPLALYQTLLKQESTCTFVTFGSYFEIGSTISDKTFTEIEVATSLHAVPNAYCVTKRMLTRFFSSVAAPQKFYHFILPTIYSEYESENRLIPSVVKGVVLHQPMHFTSGEQVRQYLSVNDVPGIIERALLSNISSGIYNIAGDEVLSVKELVANVLSYFGQDADDNLFGSVDRNDVSMKYLALDGNKLRKLIGTYSNSTISQNIDKYVKRFSI